MKKGKGGEKGEGEKRGEGKRGGKRGGGEKRGEKRWLLMVSGSFCRACFSTVVWVVLDVLPSE
jgi:hypothetical protein